MSPIPPKKQDRPFPPSATDNRVQERTRDLIEALVLMNQEIGERKQTEGRLQQEHDLISAVLDTVGALVVVLDQNGRIVRFNKACELATQCCSEEVKGRFIWDLFVSEHERETLKGVYRKLLRGGTASTFESCWCSRNGSRHLIQWTHTLLTPSTDQGKHIVAVGLDTTDQRTLEAQLLHAEKMAVLGRIASGIAHEIGNPLAFMAARLQRLKQYRNPDFLEETRRLLAEQILRMTRIIRNISTFSRAPSQEWCTCEIPKIIDETVRLLTFSPQSTQIQIQTTSCGLIPPILASKDQLQQVFLNLGMNALDAMPAGGSLTIDSSSDNQEIRIRFRDTGSGISDEIKASLFKPFFTTKPAGLGTGLGLSLSYEYIEAHGGTIEVSSEKGKGASFTVILPKRSPTESTRASSARKEPDHENTHN
jgi:PAS domain S-box-containing protein